MALIQLNVTHTEIQVAAMFVLNIDQHTVSSDELLRVQVDFHELTCSVIQRVHLCSLSTVFNRTKADERTPITLSSNALVWASKEPSIDVSHTSE